MIVRYLLIILMLLGIGGCGITWQSQPLLDEWGNTFEQSATTLFSDTSVYADNTSDVWGMEKTDCKEFKRSEQFSFLGKSCLDLYWNRTGTCPWVGMGIGWNDYGGLQSAVVLKAKHLSKYPIDTVWQEVKIPLNEYLQAAKPLADFSNIKSLNIEMQGQGHILIDEIKIVGASGKSASGRKYGIENNPQFPIHVYKDSLASTYVWGDYSHVARNQTSATRSYNLLLNLNKDKEAGMAIQQWEAVNLSDTSKIYLLSAEVKMNKPMGLPSDWISIGIESYRGGAWFAEPNAWKLTPLNDQTVKVKVPFSALDLKKKGVNPGFCKQLLFRSKSDVNVEISNVLIEVQ